MPHAGIADILASNPFEQWLENASALHIEQREGRETWRKAHVGWSPTQDAAAIMPPLEQLTWSGGGGAARPIQQVTQITIAGDRTHTIYMWKPDEETWAFSTRATGNADWTMTHTERLDGRAHNGDEIVGSSGAPIAQ